MKLGVIKNVFLFLLIIFIATSCKKAKLNKETTTSEDNALAERLFDDVFNQVDKNAEANITEKTFNVFNDNCAKITVENNNGNFPKTLIIDFGDSNCEGWDGVQRKGKITAEIDGLYKQSGTKVTITTDDYHVNNYKIDGTNIIENITVSGGNFKYSITIDGKITTPDNEEISWESSRVREWIEGADTWLWNYIDSTQTWVWNGLDGILDDVWSVSGNGSGVNREGRAFTVEITKNLRVQWCDYNVEITEGIIEITPAELKTRKVDFGDQSCDNEMTISIGKKEYVKKIRK
jgi:hypothetical protein